MAKKNKAKFKKKPGKKMPKSKGNKQAKKRVAEAIAKRLKAKAAKQSAVLPVAAAVDTEKLLKRLMEKAAERGFATEAEILQAVPHFEDNIPELEAVMDALEKRGIEIVDQEVASVWEQNKPPVEAPEGAATGKKGKGKKKETGRNGGRF